MTVVIPGAIFPISIADGTNLSPFGRVSTSSAQAIFTSQQQYGDDTIIWESQFAGTGANIFLQNEATIQMTTGGTGSTASCIRQSRLYQRYTPGHGQVIFCTFVMDNGATITNNTRRVGYFDGYNGVYLEVAGTTINLVLRSYTTGSVVETRIAQSSWSIDHFDGYGPSGIVLDWTKSQILVIDLQWLGVGRVRVAFNINGILYEAHYFEHANTNTAVYMTTANLPVRLENFNTGTASGTATLRHICNSVTTGGGVEPSFGKLYTANNGSAGTAISSGSTLPIISLRAKTTGPNSVRNTGQIIIQQYDIVVIGLNQIFWQLISNGTLTSPSFAAYNTGNSITEIDTTASAITGGIVLDAGYLNSSSSVKGSLSNNASDIKESILVYSGLLNHQDIISLVCTTPSGASTAFCNIQWLEVW